MSNRPPYPAAYCRRAFEHANAAFERRHLDLDICRQAIGVAARAHSGQCRSSDGSPYVFHPIAVATVIAHWGWGQDAVLAALLHDVVEESPFTLSDIHTEFGPKVAALVWACTKDARIECKTSRAAELQMRLQHALPELGPALAMVKLVDRAHNLFTSGHLSAQRKRELTEQSLRFYGPLAGSLGMHQFAHWLCSQPTHCGQTLDFSEALLTFAAEAAPASVNPHLAAGLRACRRKKHVEAGYAHAMGRPVTFRY